MGTSYQRRTWHSYSLRKRKATKLTINWCIRMGTFVFALLSPRSHVARVVSLDVLRRRSRLSEFSFGKYTVFGRLQNKGRNPQDGHWLLIEVHKKAYGRSKPDILVIALIIFDFFKLNDGLFWLHWYFFRLHFKRYTEDLSNAGWTWNKRQSTEFVTEIRGKMRD